MRNNYLIFTVFIITNIIFQTAFADDKIRVVTESWYPFNYLDEKGNIVGKSTKVVKAILNDSGLDYEIEINPWSRAFNLVTSQPNVLIYSILRTPDREDLFYWFCPISKLERHKVYKLTARTDIAVNAEEDIKKYTTGVTGNTFLHKYMTGLGFVDGKNLQVNSDDSVSINMFIAGRIDLLVSLDSSMKRKLNQKVLNKSIVTSLMTLPTKAYPPICMALSKKSPIRLMKIIRQAHEDFIAQAAHSKL